MPRASSIHPIILLLTCLGACAAAEHPRLLLSPAGIPALRERVGKEPWRSMAARLAQDRDAGNWGDTPATADRYDRVAVGLRAAFLYVLNGDDGQAAIARKACEDVITGRDWSGARTKGLTLYMLGSRVALIYDFCYGAPSWDAAFSAKVSAALQARGEFIVSNGGSEQNSSPASNWQGCRYAAGGLMLLASDAAIDARRIEECYVRTARYLDANLGSGPDSRGWNCEGLGYTYFPMGNYVCPFAEAMRRKDPSKDLSKVCGGAAFTLWTCSAALVRTAGGLRHPDFGDDNPGADGEGCLGFAFRWCPPELQPGLAWVYDRTVGADGDRSYDHARFGTIASILYHPGAAVPAKDPLGIPLWRKGFDDRGGNGLCTFRNSYGGDDLCLQTAAKLLGGRGHNGPDSLSFRLLGRDGLWGTGAGRYGIRSGGVDLHCRSQDALYPADPDGDLSISDDKGRIEGISIAEDGSGWVLMSAERSNVGTVGQKRLVACDWKRNGALGAFIVWDGSTNGRYWQMCSTGDIAIAVAGRTFTMTAASGTTLRGQVLYPAGSQLRTGSRQRGSKAGEIDRNNWVTASCQGSALIAFTVTKAGGRHPEATADGDWTSGTGSVSIGGWKLTLDGGRPSGAP